MDCRHIDFSVDRTKVDLVQLQALFNEVAFWARERTPEELEIALANSNPIITVWDRTRMIGFCRGISDGVYRGTIWDVLVCPKYQGLGIGRKLVETVLSHPLMCRVERVYLMTTYQRKFYERIGFQENKSTTMVLQNTYEINSLSLGGESFEPILKESEQVFG